MSRRLPVVGVLAAVALLTSCVALPVVPDPEPTPEREFAARELSAVMLTAEEYGAAWSLRPGDAGGGSGPMNFDQSQYDPCAWSTAWLPDDTSYGTQAWKLYDGADGHSNVSDWILSAAPGVDLVFTTDIGPELGDASFSYHAAFTYPDGSTAEGEVHTFICGPLWVHISYSGWEPFVERDRLVPLLVEKASTLGGCTP